MQVKLGDTIKAGYALTFRTWENDADDYRSNTLTGLSKEHAQMFLNVAPYFSHTEDEQNSMGNDDLNIGNLFEVLDNLERTGNISKEFAETYFGFDLDYPRTASGDFDEDATDIDDFINDQTESVLKSVYKFLNYPVQYDYGFIRMIETIDVKYFAEDVHIPSVPTVLTAQYQYGTKEVNYKI